MGSGPPVVLANGLGGTFLTWRHITRHLAQHYQVISWDYRGLHASEAPRDPAAVTVNDHVGDLQRLLDHLSVTRAVFLGWSMGVQVNFELFRRQPELFAGLGIINGTAGKPFGTVKGGRVAKHVLPQLLRLLRGYSGPVGALVGQLTRWPQLIPLLRNLKVVSVTLDETVFQDLATDFGQMDFDLYFRTLAAMDEHDAWDVLPRIDVPTTIVVGEHDLMTPLHVARRMSQAVRDARLVVVPHASHYVPVEQPGMLNSALDRLLERAGYPAAPEQSRN